jgi:hypothetical protein
MVVRAATRLGLAATALGVGAPSTWARSGAAGFYTLPPCRIVDSRASGGVPIGGGFPFLFTGESVTSTFSQPVRAVGAFFSAYATSGAF